tara:strand:- start:2714 stop:2974 length:261 start_codon:yes stop_codon:yes gene_type:complete
MDINQLSKIVKKKILESEIIESVKVEDKTYLHKNHESNVAGKFHIKLFIKSEKLKKESKIDSNKFIFKILENELKKNIHSIQILFF